MQTYLQNVRSVIGWVAEDDPVAVLSYYPSSSQSDTQSCESRAAENVQANTGVVPTDMQYAGTVGGHANYTFTVPDPTTFQNILNQNPTIPLPFNKGYRFGVVQSTHIEITSAGYNVHTDLFNGTSWMAPLHWIVDVGIGHIPGMNLDLGCTQ